MEQTIKLDPLIKQTIKSQLYDFLYTPVLNHFQRRLEVIIVKNTLLSGTGHKSFNYKGVLYNCDIGAPPRKWNRLLPQLKDQMEEYLKDMRELNDHELPFVLGFINQVLNASNNPGDYLRLFPDSVHHPIEKLIGPSYQYQAKKLSDERVLEIQKLNHRVIDMMKARMVTNLLI